MKLAPSFNKQRSSLGEKGAKRAPVAARIGYEKNSDDKQ